MNILAIDYGLKRVGLAVTAEDSIFELPVITYHHIHDLRDRIQQIIRDYNVQKVVIGVPSWGKITPKSQQFAQWLNTQKVEAIVYTEDLTTEQANKELMDYGVEARHRAKTRDSLSARFILQDYLEKNST
jgi:putative transcription antitermination factor YqgF